MEKVHNITPDMLTFERIEEIMENDIKLSLSEESRKLIQECRDYLDKRMATQKTPIYGINTGFGSLCNKKIESEDLSQLQENLVMSHACGTGDEVREDVVKLMLLLKAHALSIGKSGVQVITVERIIEMFNNNIIPVVYEQGSLGASGDLSPLAHLFLPLIGKGEVYFEDERISGAELLKRMNWEPIKLQSKEGLALLNGTQFMSAHATYSLITTFRLIKYADIIGALSLEGYDGIAQPFHDSLHQIRPHQGQIDTAKNIRSLLEGSELINRPKEHVQDPYSFRCMPQVHGAIKDSVNYVSSVILTEINSVTDNPTVFPDEDLVASGGNFHGEPLALALDFLAISLSELANISERRIAQLISGNRGLPEFLVANPGLNSGLMIPQYTAASIVSQNKQLSTPSSVDSIVSSNGQEDHVSMGANSATKALRVVENVERVLAIELLNAAQAIELRRPAKTSPYLEEFLKSYRTLVPFIENDRVSFDAIKESINFLKYGRFEN